MSRPNGRSFVRLVLGTAVLVLVPAGPVGRAVSAPPVNRPPASSGSQPAAQVVAPAYVPLALRRAAPARIPAWTNPDVAIDVLTPYGFRPLDGAIVDSTAPVVRIAVPGPAPGSSLDAPMAEDLSIFVAGTTPGADPVDLTPSFASALASPTRDAVVAVPLGVDSHTITVSYTAGSDAEPSVKSATMLNFDAGTLVVSANREHPIVEGDGISYEQQVIVLNFASGAPLEASTTDADLSVNGLLRRERLRPVGIGVPIGLVRAEITTGEDPAALAERLGAEPSSLLTAVLPDLVLELDSVAGERMPALLSTSYQADAGPRCAAGSGLRACFDADGPDSTNQLRIHRYHFLMDTFAGHRLVDVIRTSAGAAWPGHPVGLAVIDAGLGNGVDPCGGAPPGTTPNAVSAGGVACSDVFGVSDLQHSRGAVRFDTNGIQTTTATPRVALNLNIGNIPDHAGGHADSHGTHVTTAALARGSGAGALGTGKDVRLRPIRKYPTLSVTAYGILAATRDPDVAVINTSLGGYGNNARAGYRNAQIEGVIFDVVAAARTAGKIWVASLGNRGGNADGAHWPSAFAPTGTRQAADPLVMAVSNSETAGLAPLVSGGDGQQVKEPERLRAASNFGTHVSVAAPGGEVVLYRRDGTLRPDCTGTHSPTCSGTSFAAPVVSGLAGEMIFLDRNLRAPADRFTPLEIVEIIEATADNLGSSVVASSAAKPNDRPGDASPDVVFGHGRVNVWKALLAVANGGVAAESHAPGGRSEIAGFPSLAGRMKDAGHTEWYGFKIHSAVPQATVWIDGRRLTDGGSNAPLAPSIVAYAGVESSVASLIGVDEDGDGVLDEDPTSGIVPVGNRAGEYLATFSATRGEVVTDDDLTRPKTLSLRRQGDTVADAPFYNLRLELGKLRRGEVPGVVFDDFVFEITPPDFGDAVEIGGVGPVWPAPSYPSLLVASDGARHENTTLEWLGRPTEETLTLCGAEGTAPVQVTVRVPGVSPEVDAAVENDPRAPDASVDPDGLTNFPVMKDGRQVVQDRDRYDDGVTFHPLSYSPSGRGRADFWACVADSGSGRYTTDPDHSLFLNAWMDWDTDQQWEEENDEHIIDSFVMYPQDGWAFGNPANEPLGATTIVRRATADHGRCALYEATFNVGPRVGKGLLWSRWRIDYGEDVGRNDPRPGFRSDPSLRNPNLPEGPVADADAGLIRGAARFGEVEDYLVGTDFGDAKDPFAGPGRYPTQSDDGAFHLNPYREWLGLFRDIGQDAAHVLAASATRERAACDTSTDEDGHSNLDARDFTNPDLMPEFPICVDEDLDILDDGLTLPASFSPGMPVTLTVRVTSSIAEHGYDYPISGTFRTLFPDCELHDVHIPPSLVTPRWSQGKGRYDPFEPGGHKRLWLSIWADWDADGVWEHDSGEHIISGPLDPSTFGDDKAYTLGEPFVDTNGDGVWEPEDGVEGITHHAGKPSITLQCRVQVPATARSRFYLRARVDYGENGVANLLVVHHADAEGRALAGPWGGALWGEVEDYRSKPVLDIGAEYVPYTAVPLVETMGGALSIDVPTTYAGPPIFGLEVLYGDQSPEWASATVVGPLPSGWQSSTLADMDGPVRGLRVTTSEPASALGAGDVASIGLAVSPGGETPTFPAETWVHATDAQGRNLGYLRAPRTDRPWRWRTETVDAEGDVGAYTSIGVDARGRPTIAYRDAGRDRLKVARSQVAGLWTIADVDDGGWEPSLAFDPSGNPAIAHSRDGGELRYTRWTGSTWLTQALPGKRLSPSLAFGPDGQSRIAYWLGSGAGLVYARWEPSLGWIPETVDASPGAGQLPSLAVTRNGSVHIAYYAYPEGAIKVGVWEGWAGWQGRMVQSGLDAGGHASIAHDSRGYVHVAFFDHSTNQLRYASPIINGWQVESVDRGVGSWGSDRTLALDGADRPGIAYRDPDAADLRYAVWTGTAWARETVDAEGEVGDAASMARDLLGRPHIGYYDATNKTLKYAVPVPDRGGPDPMSRPPAGAADDGRERPVRPGRTHIEDAVR